MTPRITLLIIVGIVIYISLSLYHWRQVTEMPGAEKQNSVQSMFTSEKQENNWVQVNTSPEPTDAGLRDIDQGEPAAEMVPGSGQPAAPQTEALPATSLPAEDKTNNPPDQELQTTSSENNELKKIQRLERDDKHRQSLEIGELQAQLVSLQSALNEASSRLKKKNIALEELKKRPPSLTPEPAETANEKKQFQALKTFLASKAAALEKANERITGLGERLDQSRRTLAEAENTNAYLQSLLSNTENNAIKAQQDADQLNDELRRTREDKENYLAETGRLHSQLQKAKSRLAQLESELEKARLTADAMLRYGKKQTELTTPFRQQIEILNARVADKNSDLIKAEEQIEQIQALQLELQKNKIDTIELRATSTALNRVQKHSAKLTHQLKVLADQLNARDKKIYLLEKNLAQAQTTVQDAAQRSDVMQKETEQQQHELDTLKQQLGNSEARQQNLETELEKLRGTKHQLDTKITKQAELLTAAETEALQLTAKFQKTGKQLAGTKEELLKSQTNDNQSKATIHQLQNTLEITRTRLADAAAEISSLKESLAKAERKAAENSATDKLKQQESAEQIVSELKNENQLLLKKIRTVEQKNNSTSELKSALDQKISELNEQKERVAIMEDNRSELQSELDRRETEFFSMQEEYTSLENRFDSLKREHDALLPYTLDSDNDTISDARDSCPDTIPGADVGVDGCEQDSDHDGLVDRLDLCPEAPGPTDNNILGCTRGEPIILSGIFFSGGNAELSPASQTYLDKVAGVLELFTATHFEVAGHTDSIGEADRNLTVSKQRAEAVTDYLVARGVEPGRLVPVGLGQEQPVADNTTPEGRTENRRVELRIITPSDTSAPAEQDQALDTATLQTQ